jgi:hypothetical protein
VREHVLDLFDDCDSDTEEGVVWLQAKLKRSYYVCEKVCARVSRLSKLVRLKGKIV